ncbi:hypothetical protein AMECASPLE_039846, partial [Ameca splendens]
SNILLDQHWVPKLSDFGLARYVPRSPPGCPTQTASVGKTTTVRGTLAYLPDEYVRRGELCTAVDVYSFGVVLLEVLTGRRALEQNRESGDRYLVRALICSHFYFCSAEKQMIKTRTRRLPLYPGPGRGGSRLSRDAQTSLSPDTSSSSSGGSPRRSQAS